MNSGLLCDWSLIQEVLLLLLLIPYTILAIVFMLDIGNHVSIYLSWENVHLSCYFIVVLTFFLGCLDSQIIPRDPLLTEINQDQGNHLVWCSILSLKLKMLLDGLWTVNCGKLVLFLWVEYRTLSVRQLFSLIVSDLPMLHMQILWIWITLRRDPALFYDQEHLRIGAKSNPSVLCTPFYVSFFEYFVSHIYLK